LEKSSEEPLSKCHISVTTYDRDLRFDGGLAHDKITHLELLLRSVKKRGFPPLIGAIEHILRPNQKNIAPYVHTKHILKFEIDRVTTRDFRIFQHTFSLPKIALFYILKKQVRV